MREIKFRAYDKKDNEMFYSSIYQDKTSMAFGLSNFLNECSDIEDTLMQYTGLKDQINRNEVYEHDIINHLQYGFLKVEWDYENTGWCCFSKTYKKFSLVEILLLGGIRVGNIYENKELLQ